MGMSASFIRDLSIRLALGEEGYQEFQKILEPWALAGEVTKEAAENAVAKLAADHGLSAQDTKDLKLVAGITTAAILGGIKLSGVSKFANSAKFQDHYARHGADFGSKNALHYQQQASGFLTGGKSASVYEKKDLTEMLYGITQQLKNSVLFRVVVIYVPNTDLTLRSTAFQVIWIISMLSRKQKYLCPVCGYDELKSPPYDEFNCPTYEICPSCGTEFGYDDATVKHSDLRAKWIKGGMKWWSNSISPPTGWEPEIQLATAGFI